MAFDSQIKYQPVDETDDGGDNIQITQTQNAKPENKTVTKTLGYYQRRHIERYIYDFIAKHSSIEAYKKPYAKYDFNTNDFMGGIRLLERTIGERPAFEWKMGKRRTSAKALAISFIEKRMNNQSMFRIPTVTHYFPKDGFPSKLAFDNNVEQFARPCPKKPRHGFVDSRSINSLADFWALLDEIQETCDEKSCEVVVMPKISAQYSMIITPDGISIGKGHDGATSGKESLFIKNEMSKESFAERYGIEKFMHKIPDHPYIEAIWPKGNSTHMNKWSPFSKPFIVQVRNGPATGTKVDYIPKKMVVSNVVLAEGDLFEWETTMENAPAGTVVYQPGGTLASHYAVHGVINKIPVICSFEPKIGQTLDPKMLLEDDEEVNEQKPEYAKLAKLISKRFEQYPATWTYSEQCPAMQESIKALHSQGKWQTLEHNDKTAKGIVDAIMFAALAGIGECRHANVGVEWDYDKTDWSVCTSECIKVIAKATGAYTKALGRSSVYETVIKYISKENVGPWLESTMKDFSDLQWSSAYGGKKWYKCMEAAKKLLHRVNTFTDEPTEDNWKPCVSQWNKLVHMSHNGGHLFNKWGVNMDNPFAGPTKSLNEYISEYEQSVL